MASLEPPSSELSYVDVDVSIREQVQQAITRVAVTQGDSDSSEIDLPHLNVAGPVVDHAPGHALSMDQLEERKRAYQQEVRRLEEEVRLLEDEIERRQSPAELSDEDLERAIMCVARTRGEPSSGSEGSSLAKARPEPSDGGGKVSAAASATQGDRDRHSLRCQVKLNEAFSGIKFKSAHWEIVRKDGAVLHRKHCHSGTSYGFSFDVEFIVQEEKSEGSDPLEPPDQAKVVALRATVDQRVHRDLQGFLLRVCRDCDLMRLYQTFVKCCLLANERKQAFKEALHAHSSLELCEGSGNNRILFKTESGFLLFFTWNIVVSESGCADHSLTVQVKAPTNASDDDRATIRCVPQLLKKMMALQGPQAALLKALQALSS